MLSVSSTAPTVLAGKRAAPTTEPSLDETAEALKAQTLALRQRVANLSGMIERLQQEARTLPAAPSSSAVPAAAPSSPAAAATPSSSSAVPVTAVSATAAKTPAETPPAVAERQVTATPQAVLGTWWHGSWPFFAAVVGLAALIAAGLGWKRRRTSSGATLWPGVAGAEPGRTIAVAEAVAELSASPPRTSAAEVPRAKPSLPKPVASETVLTAIHNPSVAVSELSHVTEEAGVYLAFKRVDRAVEVLREHIRTQPHSLPAAWLMLLDIYRTNGREAEFEALAREFHRQFNAQTPTWENAAPNTSEDGGLESIPRVLDKIVSLWGTLQCREYLELLLYDNREGQRMGFSPAAYDEIMLLRQIAESTPVAVSAPAARKPNPSSLSSDQQATPLRTATITAVPKKKTPAAIDLDIALDEEMFKAASKA